ncbi:major facilitator superfamily domain-containing protein [Naematelia encephala]|uniref:Major facilitator superfamily domain-containing protein n=1 Tax=Naematelia encephala TaxID=71784 RepID=A0A1Y2BM48_9TREE|nr:major facilitator superfamily domain-containing protein [Naematelia encephala]
MAAPHDPLALGQPVGSTAQETNQYSETPLQPVSETAIPTQTASDPTHPPLPPLEHTRTAPSTVPINPVAHARGTDPAAQDRQVVAMQDSDNESSTPTLSGSAGGVPLTAGGLNGQPLPGSHMASGIPEKDHQAASMGGKTGPEIAALARKELGLGENGDTFDEKSHPPPSSSPTHPTHKKLDRHPSDGTKLERTSSGFKVARHKYATTGEDTVDGVGMLPLDRTTSQPPAVGLFGGVAPTGRDAEEGLRAVRSREEEEERDAKRLQGPDPWAVKFEPGERTNPKNWSVGYRWYLTGVAGTLVLNSTFASSAPSGIVTNMMKYFGFSQEVAVLTIALFVAGYCVGPILWGPLSESYGRRPIFLITFLVYTGFQVGCALSKNTASILIFRFLGGCFASAPLTNAGAMLADIWDVDHRGQAMSLFSLAPFAGPSIGPIVAGFISVSGTDWRWVYWILTMFAGSCLVVVFFTVPETYAPKILVQKAKRLRKDTDEKRWYAPLEKADHAFKARLNAILFKPFIMLALEPMLLACTLYMSFVYGVVYLLFEAFPFVFERNHGFNSGEDGLAFLGLLSGGVLSVVFFMTVIEPRFQRHAAKLSPQPPRPEKRLEMCVISGWALVVAMFWFGWTSYASIHWISPILAVAVLGFAVLGMFVSLFNYVIDTYLWSAASALSAMTVVRSAFGAGFPLFATQMYEKLGTQWASSLLGFLALLMAPIPMLIMKYGPTLRARSKFSPNKPK